MWSILVVDDERIEREGIAYLIEEHRLPLQIMSAANGREALALLDDNRADILLTDIKMPFMNGLELAESAGILYPRLKIVIFSAYGEFEYAKQAMGLGVVHYILKPIVVDEFLDVMGGLIRLCEQEASEREREAALVAGFERGKRYETEKRLIGLLNGARQERERADDRIVPLRLVLFEFRQRFFDLHNEAMTDLLKALFPDRESYEYVNLNEYQSILFVRERIAANEPVARLQERWEEVKSRIDRRFGLPVCIAVGRLLQDAGEIHASFRQLEQLSEYRFFYDQSLVVIEGNEIRPPEEGDLSPESAAELAFDLADSGSKEQIKAAADLFFARLKSGGAYSDVYAKYICAELVTRLSGRLSASGRTRVKEWVDTLFRSRSLEQLQQFVYHFIDNLEQDHETVEPDKRVIRIIMQAIHSRYMEDLSLDAVAESVSLSPGYVSGLFKKNTGQSFVKYLTGYRLEKAKALLLETNMKIGDIAHKVGYADISYFGTVFRSRYGMSPAKFRGSEE